MKSVTLSSLILLAVLSLLAGGLLTACMAGNHSPANSEVSAVPSLTVNPVDGSSGNNANVPGQTPADQIVQDRVVQLLEAEDYDTAIADARAELAASSSSTEALKEKLADAYIARAWFYKTKRLTTYTLADLFNAVEAAPDYYRAHYELGRFHNNQWQFSVGLLDLDKAISLKPDFAPAYAERAYSYYKNRKYEQALADVNQALEMAPADPRSLCNRSLVYLATGKTDLALEDANEAVRLSPSDAPSYYNRGLIYEAAGKPDLAMADFEATLSLSDDDLQRERASAELQKLEK